MDHCAHCGGAWFDRGELEYAVAHTLVPEVAPVAPAESDVRYLACPRCQALMTRRAYHRISGVVLDECNRHGVWADKGELERIAAFEAGSGPERLARVEADEIRLKEDRDREARAKWARIRTGLESY